MAICTRPVSKGMPVNLLHQQKQLCGPDGVFFYFVIFFIYCGGEPDSARAMTLLSNLHFLVYSSLKVLQIGQ